MNRMCASSDLPLIYIVDASVAITGAFVCARNIAKSLVGQAHIVLVLPSHSAIDVDEFAPFFAVRRMPIRPLRRSAIALLLYFPALAIASVMLRFYMWRDGARLLIINDFYLLYGPICRLLGFRGRVLTWVRIDPMAFGARLSSFWLCSAAVSSDRVVAVSKYIRDRLPWWIQADLLYDGLDPFPDIAPPTVVRDRFVYVGNYIPGKGQDHALEAFAAMADDYPWLSLHFYGGDMSLPRNRSYREDLASRILALGLQRRVQLHGFVSEPAAVFSRALGALNFSTSESFSMTTLEAQGAGVPVIATRSGGPVEIVADSESGLLVPVGEVFAMATAMRELARDPTRAADMGAAGKARVARLFSLDRFRAELIALLAVHGVIEEQRAP